MYHLEISLIHGGMLVGDSVEMPEAKVREAKERLAKAMAESSAQVNIEVGDNWFCVPIHAINFIQLVKEESY